jgi:transposase-like protein
MGDRYILTVTCPDCGFTDEDVYYAPTCDFVDWNCPKCGKNVDLEKLTGITYEDASNKDMIEDILDYFIDTDTHINKEKL